MRLKILYKCAFKEVWNFLRLNLADSVSKHDSVTNLLSICLNVKLAASLVILSCFHYSVSKFCFKNILHRFKKVVQYPAQF